MSDIITLGSTATQEQPESGQIRKARDTDEKTVVRKGTRSALETLQPAVGASYESGIVLSSVVAPLKGDLATLTVVVDMSPDDSGDGLQTGSVRWEVTWQQLEKPLLTHLDYTSESEDVAAWSEKPNRADLVGGLSEAAQKLARLILKGVESYLVFAPVVSKRSVYKRMPTTGDCGMIGDPPGAPAKIPTGYVYLKTTDQAVEQDDGKYQRTEQWTGADEWSEDLYEAAT